MKRKRNEKIYIASDHAGFKLKEKIKKFLKVEDLGPHKYDKNDDYPDYAEKVCKAVLKNKGKGILICGSGQGMSMAANKIPGIRAALCWNAKSAQHSKEDLDANVITMGSDFVSEKKAKSIVMIWLKSKFKNKRKYIRRINKLRKLERKKSKKENKK